MVSRSEVKLFGVVGIVMFIFGTGEGGCESGVGEVGRVDLREFVEVGTFEPVAFFLVEEKGDRKIDHSDSN
jgi:hypothetical protein